LRKSRGIELFYEGARVKKRWILNFLEEEKKREGNVENRKDFSEIERR